MDKEEAENRQKNRERLFAEQMYERRAVGRRKIRDFRVKFNIFIVAFLFIAGIMQDSNELIFGSIVVAFILMYMVNDEFKDLK